MDETDSTEQVSYTRVTVAEAAAILGVNVVTIRRMIKRGQLEAERVHRPQGSAYLVNLPGDGTGDATPTEQLAQDMSRTQGTPTPPAEAMVSLIQTTIGAVLGPLVAEQAALRQTVEHLTGQLVRQSETIGQLRAENRALLASTTAQPAEPTPAPPDRPLRLWQPWWAIMVAVAVALVLAVALLAWPRW
jgi:excisionase family DNA binding protein